jgi:multiple sugar transport system substrate-binding protein
VCSSDLCGGGSSGAGGNAISATSGTSSAAPADGQGVDDGTQLTLWTRSGLEGQATVLVDGYNASHKNQVKIEIVPNDDMEGKVGGAAANGELPDLLAGDVVRLPYWVDSGMFQDITDKINGLGYVSDLARGHIDAGTTPDGKMHAVPFVIDISVLVWNKDLYTQAGLDPEKGPTSLQEFADQATAVANLKQDGVAGTYFGGNCGGCNVFTWFPMIWANGEEVISAEGKTSLLDSPSWNKILTTFAEMQKNGVIGVGSREETGATWVGSFAEGKVGVMPYPAGVVQSAVDAGVNVGVIGIPAVDGGGSSTFLGGDALGISKDSKNVEQAWNFLAWMTSQDAQLDIYAKAGYTPGRVSMTQNQYSQTDPLVNTANGTIKDGRTPVAPYFAEAFNAPDSPFVQMIRAAVFDGEAPSAARNDAITEILAQ